MKNRTSFWQTQQGSSVKRGISLFLPYVLWAISLLFFSLFLFHTVISDSVYYRFLVQNRLPNTGAVSEPETGSENESSFPSIAYLSQWSTLTVEGWEKNTAIPVYFGNDTAILKKGAGTPSYTHFAGQGGKIILSAHVTRHFSELEDTKEGALVTLNTRYGTYLYRVEKKLVMEADEVPPYIYPSDEEETLILYTCYPRNNHYKARTQRCLLICSKLAGKDW